MTPEEQRILGNLEADVRWMRDRFAVVELRMDSIAKDQQRILLKHERHDTRDRTVYGTVTVLAGVATWIVNMVLK